MTAPNDETKKQSNAVDPEQVDGKDKSASEGVTRRDFVKASGLGLAHFTVLGALLPSRNVQAQAECGGGTPDGNCGGGTADANCGDSGPPQDPDENCGNDDPDESCGNGNEDENCGENIGDIDENCGIGVPADPDDSPCDDVVCGRHGDVDENCSVGGDADENCGVGGDLDNNCNIGGDPDNTAGGAPAVSTLGAVALGSALLGAGARILKKQSRQQASGGDAGKGPPGEESDVS